MLHGDPPEALARLRGSAKERPTVSTPITWDEVETRDPQSLVFEIDDVLERVAEHGDLFAAVLTKRQRLSTS
jgi:bifunctional non-homologous end joining protein LigD